MKFNAPVVNSPEKGPDDPEDAADAQDDVFDFDAPSDEEAQDGYTEIDEAPVGETFLDEVLGGDIQLDEEPDYIIEDLRRIPYDEPEEDGDEWEEPDDDILNFNKPLVDIDPADCEEVAG